MRTYITPKPNPHKPMGPICIAAGKGKAGWPSTTGNGRDNNPPKPKKK